MVWANAGDHTKLISEPNSKFVALFSEKFPGFNHQQILDLGCGPADITMSLAEQYPQAKVIGLDGADAMLEIVGKEILQHSSWPIESIFENGISAGKKIL